MSKDCSGEPEIGGAEVNAAPPNKPSFGRHVKNYILAFNPVCDDSLSLTVLFPFMFLAVSFVNLPPRPCPPILFFKTDFSLHKLRGLAEDKKAES